MKVARYIGGGEIAIVEEATPTCPPGGLLVRTEASGLCSGELMDWYMERKIPHVLGHEVAGIVEESDCAEFPVGSRVFPHHHAPCLACDHCRRGAHVHCDQWRRTKLVPGGMAERFAVGAENLSDTLITQLPAREAALIEPLACVVKAIRRARIGAEHPDVAVIGLGAMGLLHMLLLPGAVGFDVNPTRVEWAKGLGLDARLPEPGRTFDVVFVCPGTPRAILEGVGHLRPQGRLVLFSPIGPPGAMDVPVDDLYFRDLELITSYSCGPTDTRAAHELLRLGTVRSQHVISHFIPLDALPDAYQQMKRGEILKAMVGFG